jgi:sugar phosphate isomerase/epimerase
MHLAYLPGAPQLTYCTNIHAGESWSEISQSLDTHIPEIKQRISPDRPFGIGLRLSGIAANALAHPDTIAQFKEQLARLGAYVFTVNAFPYGPFHGTRVKDQVYEPDWRTAERESFTARTAYILAELLAEGGYGSISTVPGGFRPRISGSKARADVVDGLLRAALDLVHVERETGRTIALALEPEPCCFLETAEEAIAFFKNGLLSPDAIGRFAEMSGLRQVEAEGALRRHLGICYDVCHSAVEFEDPIESLRAIRGAGISIPKIQLSAAMRVHDIDRGIIERLRQFDTGTYLHQVVARENGLERYLDLPDAFSAFGEGRAIGEWRVHCHVPVFLEDLGEISSTQQDLRTVLAALRREEFTPHLEVETYTWDVLPARLKTNSKSADIARELSFVLTEFGHG